MTKKRIALAVVLFLAASAPALARGRIAGRVVNGTGSGISGVHVVLDESEAVRITDREGSYLFERVPAGIHRLTLSLGVDSRSLEGIEIESGETVTVETTVAWEPSFADEIVVAASLQVERAVDAPAAVVSLSAEAIARESGSGEIPKLLDTAPGVDVINTSGLFSEVNARGFNGYNNRRIQAFYDGVDQSVPFAGFQEYFPRNLMDLAGVEFVKGPSSSLYGANAFNGVLDMTTKPPRDSQGGGVRLTAGEPSFLRADLRWAGALGAGWFLKLVGNVQEGEYFSQSRNETTEYPGLPLEALPLPGEDVAAGTYSLRFDKQLEGGSLLTLEPGFQELSGGAVVVSFPGRFTLIEPIEQTWLRANYTSHHFDALAYYTDRQAEDFVDLSTGSHFFDDSQRLHLQIRANDEIGSFRLVGGASYREDDIGHSVVPDPIKADTKAVFGQVDYRVADLRLVLAARWDEGTLFDGRISPRAGLVWGISPHHTLRLTYNEAFQAPTYGDFFLDLPFFLPTPAGPLPMVDLSPLEASLCTPVGISCGFETPTPVRLVGNEDLDVEEITTIEAGYSGVLGKSVLLTLDYYRNELDNFITQPLFNPFGTFNSRFTPYQPPAGHPDPDLLLSALESVLGPFSPFLLQEVGGSPVFVPLGFTNAGRVDTQGVDVSVSYSAGPAWLFHFTYSWFDFDIKDEGIGGALFPNTPEHKAAFGLTYSQPRFDVSLRYRWVDDFLWGSGIWVGPVPTYDVAGVSGNYAINDSWGVGVNVVNLLDEEHWEAFGSDLLGRQTRVYATFSW